MKDIAVFTIVYIIAVAIYTEVYKKNIRNDKAKTWEIWLIVVLLSLPSCLIAHKYICGLEVPYVMFVIACQYVVDMEVVKRLLKKMTDKVID